MNITSATKPTRSERDARFGLCAGCVHIEKASIDLTRLLGSNYLIYFGERGGTRTLDPMIKSHVLYRLSYALTLRRIMLRPALCRGQTPSGQ